MEMIQQFVSDEPPRDIKLQIDEREALQLYETINDLSDEDLTKLQQHSIHCHLVVAINDMSIVNIGNFLPIISNQVKELSFDCDFAHNYIPTISTNSTIFTIFANEIKNLQNLNSLYLTWNLLQLPALDTLFSVHHHHDTIACEHDHSPRVPITTPHVLKVEKFGLRPCWDNKHEVPTQTVDALCEFLEHTKTIKHFSMSLEPYNSLIAAIDIAKKTRHRVEHYGKIFKALSLNTSIKEITLRVNNDYIISLSKILAGKYRFEKKPTKTDQTDYNEAETDTSRYDICTQLSCEFANFLSNHKTMTKLTIIEHNGRGYSVLKPFVMEHLKTNKALKIFDIRYAQANRSVGPNTKLIETSDYIDTVASLVKSINDESCMLKELTICNMHSNTLNFITHVTRNFDDDEYDTGLGDIYSQNGYRSHSHSNSNSNSNGTGINSNTQSNDGINDNDIDRDQSSNSKWKLSTDSSDTIPDYNIDSVLRVNSDNPHSLIQKQNGNGNANGKIVQKSFDIPKNFALFHDEMCKNFHLSTLQVSLYNPSLGCDSGGLTSIDCLLSFMKRNIYLQTLIININFCDESIVTHITKCLIDCVHINQKHYNNTFQSIQKALLGSHVQSHDQIISEECDHEILANGTTTPSVSNSNSNSPQNEIESTCLNADVVGIIVSYVLNPPNSMLNIILCHGACFNDLDLNLRSQSKENVNHLPSNINFKVETVNEMLLNDSDCSSIDICEKIDQFWQSNMHRGYDIHYNGGLQQYYDRNVVTPNDSSSNMFVNEIHQLWNQRLEHDKMIQGLSYKRKINFQLLGDFLWVSRLI